MFIFNIRNTLFYSTVSNNHSYSTVSNNHSLRKTLVLFLLCHLCFSPFAAPAQESLPEKTLVVENVSLIDAVNPSVQPNKTVVVVGSRIKAIGEKGKVSIPAGAKIVNGKGKYLIPGLWDSHVHLYAGKTFLPLFVANGVTSVREMGGDFQFVKQLREQVAQGKTLGPRIKMTGTFLESERWLNWATDLAKKDNHTELLESLSKRIGLASPEHARETVKKLVEDGADLIKVRNSHSPETFLAVLSEAKKYGIPVAAHAPRMNLISVSDAGLKSVEHADTVALARGDVDLKELAETFTRNGTWWTPTLVVGIKWRLTPKEELSKILNDVDGKIDERNLYVARATLEDWKQDFESQKNEGSFDWAAQTRKGMSEFRVMHKDGAGVLAGTDLGAVLTYAGFSLHDELEALVKEGGLTPFEALQSATKNPASFFNQQNEIGTVEAGKIADLVLLEANPLENISNTKKIVGVVLNGKYFSQPDLELLKETTKEQIQKENKNRQKHRTGDDPPAVKTTASAQNFTPQDFQSLRWLAGDWHGSENGKNKFYERYRFTGEDRIEMQSFKDGAMTEAGKDTSATFLKDGAIYHQVGRAVWVAERLSKTEIAFAPKGWAGNSFVWKSESPDVWTARLNSKNREGQPIENVYRLERIKNDAKNEGKNVSQIINASGKNTDDGESIRRAVLDYVEGVYEVDPSKIERGVHPELAKRGFFAGRGETSYAEYKMTFAELVELSKKYYAKTKPPAGAPKEIVIFDVSDQTASVKLTAAWGIDYMHLAKYGGRWMVVNVLWQSPPK